MGPLKPLMKKQVTIDEAANTVSVPRSLAKPPGSLDLAMKPLKPSMDLAMKPMDLSMVAELVPNGRLSHSCPIPLSLKTKYGLVSLGFEHSHCRFSISPVVPGEAGEGLTSGSKSGQIHFLTSSLLAT